MVLSKPFREIESNQYGIYVPKRGDLRTISGCWKPLCKGGVRVNRDNQKRKSGQAMLEYVVALGVFLALVGVSAALIYVFRAYGNRVLDIIAVS